MPIAQRSYSVVKRKRVIFESIRIVKFPCCPNSKQLPSSGLPRDLSRSAHARRALPVHGTGAVEAAGKESAPRRETTPTVS